MDSITFAFTYEKVNDTNESIFEVKIQKQNRSNLLRQYSNSDYFLKF